MQLWVLLLIALVAAGTGTAAGWKAKAWQVAYAEQQAAEAAAKDFVRREKEQYAQADAHEKVKTELRYVDRVITKEIEREVEKLVYRNVCLPADGLRLANEAIRAANRAASQPAAAVPAAGGASAGGRRGDPALDQVDGPGLRRVR